MSGTNILSCLSEDIWLLLWSSESASCIFFSLYLGITFFSVVPAINQTCQPFHVHKFSAILSIVNLFSDTLIKKKPKQLWFKRALWVLATKSPTEDCYQHV